MALLSNTNCSFCMLSPCSVSSSSLLLCAWFCFCCSANKASSFFFKNSLNQKVWGAENKADPRQTYRMYCCIAYVHTFKCARKSNSFPSNVHPANEMQCEHSFTSPHADTNHRFGAHTGTSLPQLEAWCWSNKERQRNEGNARIAHENSRIRRKFPVEFSSQ